MIISLNDLIVGDKFKSLADTVFEGNNYHWKDYIPSGIIYSSFKFIEGVLSNLAVMKGNFIVITHDANVIDRYVDEDMYSMKPKNVIKWFSVNTTISKPDLISIPFGLLQDYSYASNNDYLNILDLAKTNFDEKSNKVFGRYNKYEYQLNIQKTIAPWFDLKDKTECTKYLEGKSFYLTDDYYKNFEDYVNNLTSCKFVACPQSYSPDTHRVWETLYTGGVPIVTKSPVFDSFEKGDLPILSIDSWSDLDEKMISEYEYEMEDHSMLKFSYWADVIKKAKNEL